MTFLHKLARRMAGLYLLPLVFLFAASCSQGQERDFLSPNPGNSPSPLTSIEISPRVGSLRPGEPIRFTVSARSASGAAVAPEVEWSASGGTIGGDGTFQADALGLYSVSVRARTRPDLRDSATVAVFINPADILQVAISPDSSELAPGDGAQFTAWGRLPDGTSVPNPPLAWSASRGQIDGSGWYTASGQGDLWVRAAAGNGVKDSVLVHVKPRTSVLERIIVTPEVVTVPSGATQQFEAAGGYQGGATGGITEVSWSATGGSITGTGRFTAGGSPGAHRIIAKYKGGVLADTAFVTVTEPSVVGLSVAPGSATMAPGANYQFTAVAGMSDGSTRTVGASWRATGGSISPGGLYTAPAGSGSYQVIGQVAGTPYADTAAVTVSIPQATLTSLVLNPATVAVPAGSARQFSVTASYSDGSSGTPTVTWSATGGTIATGGLFTAGTVTGTFRVIAVEPGGGKADTSVVTVTPAVLRQLVLNPGSVELRPGETRQFAVAGLWSDGSSSSPPVSWTGSGGSISGAGLFTAGSAEGTFAVMAWHDESGLADTGYVTVAIPAPVLTALRVTPSPANLPLGGVLQFAVSGIRSDGSVVPVPVVWSATGGTVSSGGLYTAGQGQGLWWVVARHASGLADSAQVQVSATAPVLTSMHLAPRTVSLQVNGTRQFSASGTLSDGSGVTPVVSWTTNGGTITAGGLYLAPAVVGSYRVVATALTGGFADTALVTVTAPPVLVGLTVTPDSATLSRGEPRQFSATALYSTGGTAAVSATWSATGGTIGGSGLYAAGQIAGSFRVVAQSGAVADTAPVRILGPVATGLVLTPDSASLSPGGTQQFSTTTTWSDGGSYPSTVTYSATGGTITSGGMYTAGLTAGTFLVIASCSCGVADSSVVAIQAATPPPVVLQTLAVTPALASVASGASFQFTVSGTWSDGGSTVPVVTWTATGGAISSSGLFTAGGTTGTYEVSATHAASGLSAPGIVTITPPQAWSTAEPELPRVFLNTAYVAPTGTKILVNAGANLQAALDAARPGDEILLAPGAVFTGQFTLRSKSGGTGVIVIRTNVAIPPEGTRMTPAVAASLNLAKIVSNAYGPVIRTSANSSNYRIMGVEVTVQASITSSFSILRFGTPEGQAPNEIPGNLVLDRAYVHGHPTLGVRRCVELHSKAAAVVDSWLSECHVKGGDSQAIWGANGPGPYKIVNNHLEGAGENIMFGGMDPSNQGMLPADIEIRRNFVVKPLEWQVSGAWTVKNLFELKIGKRVLVEGNVFENVWADGQVGTAIVLKSTNQSGGAPWSETSDVTFQYNLIRNVAGSAFSLAANPETYPVVPMNKVAIRHNLVDKLGAESSFTPGSGRFVFASGALADLQVSNNTAVASTRAILFGGNTPLPRFTYLNNIVGGSINSDAGQPWWTPALDYHASPWKVAGNLFITTLDGARPGQNSYVATTSAVGFVSSATGNYELASNSPFWGTGTDARAPGVDMTALNLRVAGVIVP